MRAVDVSMFGLFGIMLLASVVAFVGAPSLTSGLQRGESTTVAPAWKARLHAVDAALERHDVSTAVRAWHDAYGAALASRQWQPMLEAGDAFVRIGAHTHAVGTAKPQARQAYLVALMRAESARSPDGVLRAAEAFEALGDTEMGAACRRIAARLHVEVTRASARDQ